MEKPLFTTFLAEVENLAKEFNLEMTTFGYNYRTVEQGLPHTPALTIKFQPTNGKGNK